jgi:hypothetical protein
MLLLPYFFTLDCDAIAPQQNLFHQQGYMYKKGENVVDLPMYENTSLRKGRNPILEAIKMLSFISMPKKIYVMSKVALPPCKGRPLLSEDFSIM